MDDLGHDEDKKPFDSQIEGDEDGVPDPDEEMAMDAGGGRIWLVKIPKFLLERWSAVEKEGVQLATLRIYNSPKPVPGRKDGTRFILMLPPATPKSTPGDPSGSKRAEELEPEVFELEVVHNTVENQVVIAEQEKNPGVPNDRARRTFMTGRVKHECNLRPMLNHRYRRLLRERTRVANTPAKQVVMLDGFMPQGSINQISSGMGNSDKFRDLVRNKGKPAKGTFERMARMPKNELLDHIFNLYQERDHWTLKDIRQRTQQPEAYLKEVLSDVATLNRAGEFNGHYELKDMFKTSGVKPEFGAGPSSFPQGLHAMSPDAGGGDGDMDGFDDDDDDDDDDDMEEIS